MDHKRKCVELCHTCSKVLEAQKSVILRVLLSSDHPTRTKEKEEEGDCSLSECKLIVGARRLRDGTHTATRPQRHGVTSHKGH